jgi:hypothetical protein
VRLIFGFSELSVYLVESIADADRPRIASTPLFFRVFVFFVAILLLEEQLATKNRKTQKT